MPSADWPAPAQPAYQALLAVHPEPMWVFDTESWRFLAVNDPALTLFACERDVCLAGTILDVCAESELRRVQKASASATAGFSRIPCVEIRGCQGARRHLEWLVHRLIWDDRPACLVLAHDVTASVEASDARHRTDAWFRTTLYSLGEAVITTDRDARILQMNSVAEALTGWHEDQACGRPLPDVLHLTSAEAERVGRPHGDETRTGLTTVSGRAMMSASDGGIRAIVWTAAPIRDDSGTHLGSVIAFRDETPERAAALRQREMMERLEATLGALPDPLFELDRGGRILASRQASGLPWLRTDIAPEGRLLEEVVDPDSAAVLRSALEQTLLQGRCAGVSWAAPGRDGLRWFELSASRGPSEAGGHSRIMVLVRDVTERKQVEESLRASTKMLQQVLDTIPVRVLWKDRAGRFLGGNRLVAHDAGVAGQDALVGLTDRDVPWRVHADAYRADDEWVVESGQSKLGYEEPQVTPDGRELIMRTSKVPLRTPAGDVQGVLITYEDVTDQKRAEQALRRSEAALAESQRVASLGHFDVDVVHDRWSGSEQLDTLFELDAGGWRDMHDWFELIHPEDRAAVTASWTSQTQGVGGRFDCEYRIRGRRTGVVRWVHGIGRVEFGPDGAPLRIFGTVQDISDRRRDQDERERLHAQLLQSQKMESVGRLAGGVAHDFNNMLQAIIGNVELAIEDASGTLLEQLNEVLTIAHRSADLTRQLLAFARRQTVAPRVLDLNDLVNDTQRMLRRLVGEDLVFVWEPCAGVWPIRIDPAQVNQILANLVVNARDAIHGHGSINVSTANVTLDDAYCSGHPWAEPGEYVRLSVSDTGVGMSAETMAHLFEPFFTTKELGKGTGLGLATVYGIVKQNDGVIEVVSHEGNGTTVSVFVPRALCAAPLAEAREAQVRPGGNETVLLVEDEDVILALVRTVLERRGYNVLAVRTPSEALALVQGHSAPIHLLVTDLVLPEMSGHDLAVRLTDGRPSMRCLLMSGYATPARPVESPGGVWEHFIEKPFTAGDLAAKVRSVLDARSR